MENTKIEIDAKCPLCGAQFKVTSSEIKTVCPSCGEEISTSMAIKYYSSLNENPSETKEAHGEDYVKLQLVLDEIYGNIALGRYEDAEAKYEEALTLSNTDYKIYMAMVAIKTKNYTDLSDESHKEYINKAIACADPDQKKEIVKIYRPYYQKTHLTEEELEVYSEEENKVKKQRVESQLKTVIPEYMVKEKRLKTYLILFPIFIVLGISTVVVASFIEEIKWVSIIGAVVTIIGYLFFRNWFTDRDKVKTFNAILDFYDYLENKNYNAQTFSRFYDFLLKFSERFIDNEPVVSMADDTVGLIDFIISINDEELNSYVLKDAYFSQYVESTDEEK